MNEPIISPWLIYALSILNDVITVSGIGFVLSAIGFLRKYTSAENDDEFYKRNCIERREVDIEKANAVRRRTKRCGIACVVFFLIVLFVPSEKVCWKMIIASKVTPNMVQQVGDNAEVIAHKTLDLITDSVIRIMKEVDKQ